MSVVLSRHNDHFMVLNTLCVTPPSPFWLPHRPYPALLDAETERAWRRRFWRKFPPASHRLPLSNRDPWSHRALRRRRGNKAKGWIR